MVRIKKRLDELQNYYIAHQEKSLDDKTMLEAELNHWIATTVLLCKAAPPTPAP